MRFGERLALAVALLIGIFGFVILAGVLIGSFEGTSQYSLSTNLLLSCLFGVFPLAGGLFLFWRVRRAVARRKTLSRRRIASRSRCLARLRQEVTEDPADRSGDGSAASGGPTQGVTG